MNRVKELEDKNRRSKKLYAEKCVESEQRSKALENGGETVLPVQARAG